MVLYFDLHQEKFEDLKTVFNGKKALYMQVT
jgi:hypothetical protein